MKHNGLFFKSMAKSLFLLLCLVGVWSCGGGGGGGEGSATTTQETCAPAPSSAIIENVLGYGATGDDDIADTAAIQDAVDAVAGTGGTVWIPEGTYMINAVQSIRLGSDMTLRLDPGAVLKAIPNSATSYAVLLASGVSNVNIVGGGILEGELSEHDYQSGTTSQWGHCLKICNHSNHIVVEDITVKEAMGDGFYISYGNDVTFCNVIADHNRRQGLSLVDADHVVVRNSVFANTIGFLVSGTTMSGMGIDIEPNPNQTVNDVLITGCTFTNNRY